MGAGLSQEGIRKAREGKAESALDDAVASLARRVVDTRGQVSDADLAAARSAGLGDEHIVEVIANYTNNVAMTDIDFPKVDVELRPVA
jgi:hypothetical protein